MSTKDKVLELLLQNKGQSVSGEKIASYCQVSRAAVWKAVNALREQGLDIQGATNGGYILNGSPDIFSAELFESFLSEQFPSFSQSHVECFSTIDSTNTYAKKLLSQVQNIRLPDGTLTEEGCKLHQAVIAAETQTAGRGRLGRTFYSPAKTGIYLSVIYAPEGGITDPSKLTAFSAVAVCRAIKKLYGIEPQIKWINDIFVNGKKIAGILTEGFTNFETGRIESAVIGIGINIQDNPSVFPPELSAVAGSILGDAEKKSDAEKKVSRCEFAANVAGQVLTVLSDDENKIMDEYKKASFLIGRKITVHPVIGDDLRNYQALVTDIDKNANLVVQLEDGSVKALGSGEVSLHSDAVNVN